MDILSIKWTKDIKNTLKFLREFKLNKGIIITKNLEKEETFSQNNKNYKTALSSNLLWDGILELVSALEHSYLV